MVLLASDAGYSFLANNGRKFYFHTNLDAPRYRVVSIVLPEPGSATESDPAAIAKLKWKEVRVHGCGYPSAHLLARPSHRTRRRSHCAVHTRKCHKVST